MRRWKLGLILFVLFLGLLYAVEDRFHVFRLRSIDISPSSLIDESIIWRAIPTSTENFWLSLLWNERAFKSNVEGFYPVEMRVKVAGWGRYRIELSPLEPLLWVSWSSRVWILSTDGKTWLADLPANTKVRGLKLPIGTPLFIWGNGMPVPIDIGNMKGDIVASSLPVSKMKEWLRTLDEIGWLPSLSKIIVKKVDGRPVVQLLFGPAGFNGAEIIAKDDPKTWRPLAQAMKGLFPDPAKMPANILLDATYKDKFTVRSRDFN